MSVLSEGVFCGKETDLKLKVVEGEMAGVTVDSWSRSVEVSLAPMSACVVCRRRKCDRSSWSKSLSSDKSTSISKWSGGDSADDRSASVLRRM